MNSPYYARRCYGTTTQFLWERARHALIDGLGRLRIDQPTITRRTRPAPDAYSPPSACDDCTFVDQFLAGRLQAWARWRKAWSCR